jgi:uncharacterized protein (DUF4415 family)
MNKSITSQTSGTLDSDDYPYDPDDPKAVADYWNGAKITLRGKEIGRAQRPGAPDMQRVTAVALSSEVIDFFKAGGGDWQRRIDQLLLDYVHRQTP